VFRTPTFPNFSGHHLLARLMGGAGASCTMAARLP
jgi:hypothetical protein